MHAAKAYEVKALGVPRSEKQQQFWEERTRASGLGHLVEVRLRDYPEVSETNFDMIFFGGNERTRGR